MGEVKCRQILPLPQDKPGSKETASNETSGKCRCAGEKEREKTVNKRRESSAQKSSKQQAKAGKGKKSRQNKQPNRGSKQRHTQKHTESRQPKGAKQSKAEQRTGLKLRQSSSKEEKKIIIIKKNKKNKIKTPTT